MIKTISSTQVRKQLSQIIDEVRYQKVIYVITKHDKPCCKIIPYKAPKKR